MTLADRIAVMDKGQVKQIGRPGEVYEFPNSRFVAGFIGSVTSWEATVVNVADGMALVHVPDLDATLQARAVPNLAPGQAISLALRPEKLTISRTPLTSGNVIAGEVKDLAYFGKDSLYRIALKNGGLVSVHAVNARRAAEEERVADWYDKVWLSFEPSAAIILTD